MKELYIPSMDDLYEMQDMGVNIYKYILVKAIEKIALDGVNHSNKGMLKNAYRYIKENLYIASAIGMMYPEEIKYSQVANMDVNLCMNILNKREDTKSNLDYLGNFDNSTLMNTMVIDKVLLELIEKLQRDPKYRFEYKQNYLLDRIFKREITSNELMFSKALGEKILKVEPAYILTLLDILNISKEDIQLLFNQYASTYGIPNYVGEEYRKKDILTNPDTDVKRLLKTIKK